MYFRKTVFTVLVLSLFSVAQVQAQTQTQTQIQSQNESQSQFDFVVTGKRFSENSSMPSSNLTVIDGKDIQKSGNTDFKNILRQNNIQVSDATGNGKSLFIDLAGFGETSQSNTTILIDGVKINSLDLSGANFRLIGLGEIGEIEKIEIIKGSSGAIVYGDNTSGGVINIITKKTGSYNKLSAKYGSYKTYSLGVQTSSKLDSGTIKFSDNFNRSNGYRENSGYTNNNLQMSIDSILSENITNFTSVNYNFDKSQMPGALSEDDLAKGIDRIASKSPNDYSKTNDVMVVVKPTFLKEMKDFGKSECNLEYVLKYKSAESVFSRTSYPSEMYSNNFSPKCKINDLYNGEYLFGVDGQVAKLRYLDSNTYLNKNNIAGFLNYEYQNKIIKLGAGTRYDMRELQVQGQENVSKFHPNTLYSVYSAIKPLDALETFLRFTKSAREPLLDEYYNIFSKKTNDALTSQIMNEISLGGSLKIQDDLMIKSSLALSETKNEIFYNPIAFDNSNYNGKISRTLFDISINKKIENFQFGAKYSLTNAKFKTGDFEKNHVPGVSPSKFVLSADYTYINTNFSFVSTTQSAKYLIGDFQNKFSKDGSNTLLNFAVSQNFKSEKGKTPSVLSLSLNNILNKKHSEYSIASFGKRYYYPAQGFSFNIGLTLTDD